MLLRDFVVVAVLLSAATVVVASLRFWEGDVAKNIAGMSAGTYNPYMEFNMWVNGLFYHFTGLSHIPSLIMEKFGSHIGYYLTTYLRDLVAGTLVYWLTAGTWHLVIYTALGKKLFVNNGRPYPTMETIADQMLTAQTSLFIYAALPVFSEFLIESKLTRTYFYIDQVGGYGWYFLYLLAYIILVEIGIYWMHRILHENKLLYKYIHGPHHKYNKAATLTPWASIAFNPWDGILQASPYVICLFIVPVHYFTHMFLLFFSGVWATNIHDAVWGDTEPVMGSKYHTVHHTHYHYNFGQFFIFCDWFWGTLKVPDREKFGKATYKQDLPE